MWEVIGSQRRFGWARGMSSVAPVTRRHQVGMGWSGVGSHVGPVAVPGLPHTPVSLCTHSYHCHHPPSLFLSPPVPPSLSNAILSVLITVILPLGASHMHGPSPARQLVHPWWPALSPCFLSPLSHPLLSLLSSLSPVSLRLPVSLCLSGSHPLHLPLSLPLLVCFDPAHPLVSLPISLALSFSLFHSMPLSLYVSSSLSLSPPV